MSPKTNLTIQITLAIAVFVVGVMAFAQSSRITALEDEVALLRTEPAAVEANDREQLTVEAGERVKRRREGRGSTAGKSKVAALETMFEAASEEDAVADITQTPEIREALREVVAEEAELRNQERWQKRLDKRTEQTRERVSSFASAAGVSSATKEQIEEMLVTELTEVSSIFQDARENFAWADAREKVEAVRKETDENAKDVLDDDEFAEYQKMREDEIAQFRGGRGGRRNAPNSPNVDSKNKPAQ